MTAGFSTVPFVYTPLQGVAQAYGAGTYNSNSYNGTAATGTTATPLPPNTGVHLPTSAGDIALLFALAIVIGAISYVIGRLIKRRKSAK